MISESLAVSRVARPTVTGQRRRAIFPSHLHSEPQAARGHGSGGAVAARPGGPAALDLKTRCRLCGVDSPTWRHGCQWALLLAHPDDNLPGPGHAARLAARELEPGPGLPGRHGSRCSRGGHHDRRAARAPRRPGVRVAGIIGLPARRPAAFSLRLAAQVGP